MADVHICLVNKLYEVICRDPDTATGGITPTESTYHADCFARYNIERLERLKGSAFDRKVQIEYKGALAFGTLTNGIGGKRSRNIMVSIRVGYYLGDHDMLSQPIIGADDFLISKTISKPSNYPVCEAGCVMGIVPLSSSVTILDAERQLLEINVQCTIYQ